MIEPGNIPLALYVHLPWCVRKCPYCDFNSHAVPSAGLPERAYLQALLQDLEHAVADVQGRPLVSVFFGGGTPSLFSARSIAAVLEKAGALMAFTSHFEVTLEANPGTIERGKFKDYAAAGVNRVSLGAQSFDDRKLQVLGRIHSAAEIDRAVAELTAAGLDNFNIDLMYALPEQTVDEALQDVSRAAALGSSHISHYQLTLEPQTPFARRPPAHLPDDDQSYEMQEHCQAFLADQGYAQYEVSAYARSDRRCAHNLVYWTFGDYLGIGAGAHGKVTAPDGSGIVRTVRARHPAAYLGAATPADRITEQRKVAAADLPFEYCLNTLRLADGFSLRDFERRTGLKRAALQRSVGEALSRGLLTREADRVIPSPLGRRFLNRLQAMFLPI
jgi:putative oxygen-independent coproporphyrinogen III oxidase